jgi:hypothetical protein
MEILQKLLGFALVIGNSASPILKCHSEGILFQSGTVLNNKHDAYEHDIFLYLCKNQ